MFFDRLQPEKGTTVYHGNIPALRALDELEQKFKEHAHHMTEEQRPGLELAWRWLQDVADDNRPREWSA